VKNVLIVDDNAVVRAHLKGLLERDACLVSEAVDGLEGLAQAKESAWDVIFLDLQMPGLDGLGVLAELQRMAIKTPVALITSSESSAEILKAYKLGAKEYLLKPFHEDQVRRVMRLITGLDPTTLSRTPCHVAVLDPDEAIGMTARTVLSSTDRVDVAETVQAVPETLAQPHQVVLIGGWEAAAAARADEAEALGDLASQRDPNAVLVRLLDEGGELPDVTVFHAGISRVADDELKQLVQTLRSAAVITSGRTVRALRFRGHPRFLHLYWWVLTRSLRAALERLRATGGSATIDLSLAPEDTARDEFLASVKAEADANMFKLRVAHGVERLTLVAPPASHEGKAVSPFEATALRSTPAPASHLTPPITAVTTPPSLGAAKLIIPGYEIGELVGEGGMSRVYRATQRSLRRQVCVKLLRDELADEPGLAERFQDEGIALATLRHPNIVSVLDVGRAETGQLYLLMEWIEGGDLRTTLKRETRLPWRDAVTLTTQLLSGLAEAHAAGIVHRDIKPSNVLLATLKDGSRLLKLVDFGIAKLMEGTRASGATRIGQIIGTPGYMAPEQFLGLPTSRATDLYAVGIVLFELITGRRPFVARDELEMAQLTMLTSPPKIGAFIDASVPVALDQLVLELLAKNAADRPASAAATRDRLLGLLAEPLRPTG